MIQNVVGQSRFESTDTFSRLGGSEGRVIRWAADLGSPNPVEEAIRAALEAFGDASELTETERVAFLHAFLQRLTPLWESYSSVDEPARVEHRSVLSSSGSTVLGHRSRELEWCRTHKEVLRQLAGQWVVLEGEGIIAHGNDPLQVVAEARAKGIQVPYIFRVEITAENAVRMGL